MSLTIENVREAISTVLAKERADVVSSWANEQDAGKRERLWLKHQSIDSIEEVLNHEFTHIIERATGGPGTGDGAG